MHARPDESTECTALIQAVCHTLVAEQQCWGVLNRHCYGLETSTSTDYSGYQRQTCGDCGIIRPGIQELLGVCRVPGLKGCCERPHTYTRPETRQATPATHLLGPDLRAAPISFEYLRPFAPPARSFHPAKRSTRAQLPLVIVSRDPYRPYPAVPGTLLALRGLYRLLRTPGRRNAPGPISGPASFDGATRAPR